MLLENLNHAQRERLAFIDFSLEFFGQIARADLIQKFGTGLASCTRDLSLYREIGTRTMLCLCMRISGMYAQAHSEPFSSTILRKPCKH